MATILITGAGTGLGKELAIAYAKNRNKIILLGRTVSKLKEVQKVIEEFNGHAHIAKCDITNRGEVKETIENLKNSNTIDQVINNAGVGYFGPLQELSDEEIDQMLDTNLKGTINMTKAILPIFLQRNSGKIMNIISTAGLRGKVNESVYVASKFAVRGFTESLIKEVENTGISVSAVYMGGMDTPFWDENHFISDRSRLKSAKDVAQEIVARDNEQKLIIEK